MIGLLYEAGWLAIPTVLLAISAVGTAAERTLRLGLIRLASRKDSRWLDSILSRNRLHELAKPARRPVARVLAAAAPHFGGPLAQIADALELEARREARRLHRGLGLLHLVAVLAPVCGLCGTVLAFAFTMLEVGSRYLVSPYIISNGIAEAFTTTLIGLAVAIPTQIALTVLRSWAERSEAEIEDAVNRVLLHMSCYERGS